MYHPQFCPDCGRPNMVSRDDTMSRCQCCGDVFVIVPVRRILEANATPAQLFMEQVTCALNKATSESLVVVKKGGADNV